jgi:hypothetical protein
MHMQRGRDDDADGIHLTKQFPVIAHQPDSQLARDTLSRFAIGVGHGHQATLRQCRVLFGVKLAEVADSNYGAFRWFHGVDR